MKLSLNTQLEKGILTQLPAYIQSENGDIRIFKVILTHDWDLNKVNKLINRYNTIVIRK